MSASVTAAAPTVTLIHLFVLEGPAVAPPARAADGAADPKAVGNENKADISSASAALSKAAVSVCPVEFLDHLARLIRPGQRGQNSCLTCVTNLRDIDHGNPCGVNLRVG
ncbi:hypothetical protein GCM10023079_11190 [Streptomyces chitinivorans]